MVGSGAAVVISGHGAEVTSSGQTGHGVVSGLGVASGHGMASGLGVASGHGMASGQRVASELTVVFGQDISGQLLAPSVVALGQTGQVDSTLGGVVVIMITSSPSGAQVTEDGASESISHRSPW